MRPITMISLCFGVALFLAPAISSAAPVCKGGDFGRTCVKCDTGACYDAATKKIGACVASRCGEAAKPFKPPARDENTGS